ncbi:MAG: hypothetical protein JWQ04_2963, partial [Pedosphaera sp.]|nr:hypothetical protein [Pedosphaera sp.]
STRWHIKDETFDSIDQALANTVENYRRNLWATQEHYIEVWVEKDAIASIIASEANKFGVPVFVARGFASLSSLYGAAETFKKRIRAGKVAKIYHFGDYDPSGVAAGESIVSAFENDFKVFVHFERAAITSSQIQQFNLPTRPVKMSDSRAAKWTGGECVELDSMPPAELRRLVESRITRHINQREWKVLQQTEAAERETLEKIRIKAAK